MRFPAILFNVILGFVFLSCNRDLPTTAGGSTGLGNCLTGQVVNAEGAPAAKAMVRLFESHYDPTPGNESALPETTYTDTTGAFRFSEAAQGTYNIVANDVSTTDVAAAMGLTVTNSAVAAGTHRLKKPGSLSGTAYDSLTRLGLDSAHIYVQGLPFYTQVDANADFNLALPEGTFRLTARTKHSGDLVDGPVVHVVSDSITLITEALFPITFVPESLSYAGYHLTFSDEFDGIALDWQSSTNQGGKWGTYYKAWNSRTINNPLSYIVDPEFKGTDTVSLNLNPFEVSNGTLKIICDTTPQVIKPYLYNYDYYSGMISCESTFCQTYGIFEIRCKMPAAKGLGGDMFLNTCSGSWPPGIGVFGIEGTSPDTNITSVYPNDSLQTLVFHDGGMNGTDTFHTYAVEWLPDRMIWYRDGVAFRFAYRSVNEPMYLHVALSAKQYPVAPDSTTPFPSKMEIDYIRVYSK